MVRYEPMATLDPLWSDVAGVSLHAYARITARALQQGLAVRDMAQVASAEGIAAADWEIAAAAWRARMGASEEVRIVYAALYAAARVK